MADDAKGGKAELNPLLRLGDTHKAKRSKRAQLEQFEAKGRKVQVARELVKRASVEKTAKVATHQGHVSGTQAAKKLYATDGVDPVSYTQSTVAALRGADDVMALKKVVLPPADGTPDAKVIAGAIGKMGLADAAVGDTLATATEVEVAFQRTVQRSFPSFLEVAKADPQALATSAEAAEHLMEERANRFTQFDPTLVAGNPSLSAAAQHGSTQYEGDALIAAAAVLQARVRESAGAMHRQLAKVAGKRLVD